MTKPLSPTTTRAMTNPYRAMCAELLLFSEEAGEICINESLWHIKSDPDCTLLQRAHALLAQPELPELTDEEIDDWCGECSDLTRAGEADHYWVFGDVQGSDINAIVRAAYARWGCPAPPPREP